MLSFLFIISFMKKKFYILLTSLLSVFAIVFVLRFVIGGDEDIWLCEDGEWVKHGQPASDHPSTGCGEKKLVGGDKDSHGCLIAAGYSWCSQKEKCLSFCGIGKTTFKWTVTDSQEEEKHEPIKKEVEGKVFSAENLENVNSTKIDDFFKENSFLLDKYNALTKNKLTVTSYKKDNLVCLITTTKTGYDPSNPEKTIESTNTTTLKVECGEILE